MPEAAGRRRRRPVALDRVLGVQRQDARAPLLGVARIPQPFARRSVHRDHVVHFALLLRGPIRLGRAAAQQQGRQCQCHCRTHDESPSHFPRTEVARRRTVTVHPLIPVRWRKVLWESQ